MLVYVTVSTFQGCLDEVKSFRDEDDALQEIENWEERNGIHNEDDRDYKSMDGIEIQMFKTEVL